jgi:hypothetical protein
LHLEGSGTSSDGELRRRLLESFDQEDAPTVLRAYVRRASRGADDAALVTGTGKDLLEATAAYVLVARRGYYDEQLNFRTLLGQAFVELGMATPEHPGQPRERGWEELERTLFETACAVNKLRNKEGTGHGRPFQPNVSDVDSRIAIQAMGTVAQLLLDRLH